MTNNVGSRNMNRRHERAIILDFTSAAPRLRTLERTRPWCDKGAQMANINWRTINIDALDPESASNFDLSTLTPAVIPVSTSDVQTLSGQIRQLMRGGDNEGALRGALENVPYGADEQGKVGPPIREAL